MKVVSLLCVLVFLQCVEKGSSPHCKPKKKLVISNTREENLAIHVVTPWYVGLVSSEKKAESSSGMTPYERE